MAFSYPTSHKVPERRQKFVVHPLWCDVCEASVSHIVTKHGEIIGGLCPDHYEMFCCEHELDELDSLEEYTAIVGRLQSM